MLRKIIIALVLALMWVLITARATLESFVLGFVLGLAIVYLLEGRDTAKRAPISLPHIIATLRYGLVLLRQIIVSDILVIRRILAPQQPPNSGLVEVDVISQRDVISALSAHAITSAPGSFVVEFTQDGQRMMVHAIDKSLHDTLDDEQEARAQLCERMLGHE